MSFFTEQLGRLKKAEQQAQRNHADIEAAAHALVSEIRRCWGMHAGVRFGIMNAIDFSANRIGAISDERRSEFLVDVEFRGEDLEAWNLRLSVVATLTRSGISMAFKRGRDHRVDASRAESFHPLIAELELATDAWVSQIESRVWPK